MQVMRLNPGRDAVSLQIKDASDLAARSQFRDIYVRTLHPDWCYENCYYVPEARWEEPSEKANETT